jgi:hypothetical protein
MYQNGGPAGYTYVLRLLTRWEYCTRALIAQQIGARTGFLACLPRGFTFRMLCGSDDS